VHWTIQVVFYLSESFVWHIMLAFLFAVYFTLLINVVILAIVRRVDYFFGGNSLVLVPAQKHCLVTSKLTRSE